MYIIDFLDLANFNTSLVTSMWSMFYYCSSLTSLDLSNFDTSLVTSMGNMFSFCTNLEYINLTNFDETNLVKLDDMFKEVPENVVICINENSNEQKILSQLNNKKCLIIDCTKDWKSKQKKLIDNVNKCFESCDKSSQYEYEYNGKCYENCQKGFIYDENDNQIKKCKYELDKCLICPNVALNKDLCTKCNDNYYPKENDSLNLGEYINCYNKIPEGYYLDNNLYKQCYYS